MNAPLRPLMQPLVRSLFQQSFPSTGLATGRLVASAEPTLVSKYFRCQYSHSSGLTLPAIGLSAWSSKAFGHFRDGSRSISTTFPRQDSTDNKNAPNTPNQTTPPGQSNSTLRSSTTNAVDPSASLSSQNGTTQSPGQPPPTSPLALRIHHLTEQLLTTFNRVSQQLNIYTGTDYTPISSLRTQIGAQETNLLDLHAAVSTAKTTLASAATTQSSSQKEVVQLLARKHSWSATDLERYMSLIRSEHEHEQAVAAARKLLVDAERALEDGRQLLERMERRMYHEEQVWSDTIRRNSSWITFGLMGLNMALLLANLVLVEPWRRRRLVKELTAVVDEKTGGTAQGREVVLMDEDGVLIDTSKGGKAVDAGTDTQKQPQQTEVLVDLQGDADALGSAALEVGELPSSSGDADASDSSWMSWLSGIFAPGAYAGALSRVHAQIDDLFSERVITTRQVDLTNAALEGFAAGFVAVVVALWVLERALD